MIDCSQTLNFFKERDRLTNHCIISCKDCPLADVNNKIGVTCGKLMQHHTEKAIEILQKWSDENPVKTRLDDFKEKYQNYMKRLDKTPIVCCEHLGYTTECNNNCLECWDMPL